MDFGKDEQRLTRLGRFLRRTKIDEFPQLLNVLFGDMSLIGPRPTIRQQVDEYSERQMKRLQVKPGMTGLAQVNGNASISWEERIEYDVEYVENFSLWLDLKILLKTAAIVVLGEEKFRRTRQA
jgi:lipopolysaccharide/colanic/teichoic acid biosynthesis glycosyltransferase